MRPRFVVLAALATTLSALALPLAAAAAPVHNRGLTVNVTPNPILAGQSVFIYGQLNDPPVAGQTIVLYHHLAGSSRGYTRVTATTTDARGFYEFIRPDGVVTTNRSWFVREAGGHRIHSRTVFERVAALASLTTATPTATTGQSIVLTGHVDPNHAGEPVLLQSQVGSSDVWHTLKTGVLGPGSNFAITLRFRLPGDRDLRILFRGDGTNTRATSDPLTVSIMQAQVPGFTVNTTDPRPAYGEQVTISGVLNQVSPASAPEPNTPVTLWARPAGQFRFTPVADTTTGAGGSYTFGPQMPTVTTAYQVRTTLAPHRQSGVLVEGVNDAVSMTPSATTSTVGGVVTFDGTVLPDKAGHVIYLQLLGADGDWHRAAIQVVRFGSRFRFRWKFGQSGTFEFRARITRDRANIGGASSPVTIQVSPATNPATLPPASTRDG